MNRLADKVVVVTGGTRGIGEAITRLFAAEGAIAAFCGLDRQRGQGVERDVRDSGGRVQFTVCDASSESEVATWIERVVATYGKLDAVVNNAAIGTPCPLEEMPLSDWNHLLSTNITSMFLVCRAAIPHLRANGGGSIVNLGSTYGVVGAPNWVAYGLTKAAAISLSKGLALELSRDRIRVNALCPGSTDTALPEEREAETEDRASVIAKHPLGRYATPEEQARAALFLVSDDASFVTGHALLVDGGYTAQ